MSKDNVIEFTPGNVKAATAGLKSGDLWNVPFEALYIQPGFNVREPDEEYEAHLESLTQSMVDRGYDRTKPMTGYIALIGGENRIVVTDGHSRYAALGRARERGADIQTVSLVTTAKGTSAEDLTVSLVTSNNGKALKPYEIGTVCKRLIGFGWEPAQIASKIGVTEGYVNDLLLLHGASKKIRDLVRTGKLAAGTAISTLKRDPENAEGLLTGAVETAAKQGKKKATKKDIAPNWKQAVKKAGPELFDGLMWVKEDKGYSKLSEATRERLDEILGGLPEEPEKVKKARGG